MSAPTPPPARMSITLDTRAAAVGVVVLALVAAGLIWYFAVYDTAENKCQRGDLGACLVVAGQQQATQASASASAEAVQASASAEAAQASAAAAQQAQAAESAAASASASASAAAVAAVLAREQATCQHVRGSWDGSICRIDYTSPDDGQTYHYTVSFDASGNVEVAPCSDTAWAASHGCSPEPVQAAKADCLNGSYSGVTSYWHADTDICSI